MPREIAVAYQQSLLTKKEFNIRFLMATRTYMPKVARNLVRECRDDIKIFGLEYAQKKWAKFVGKECNSYVTVK